MSSKPQTRRRAGAAPGAIFGTGSAPRIEMIRAWEEAQAPEKTADEA